MSIITKLLFVCVFILSGSMQVDASKKISEQPLSVAPVNHSSPNNSLGLGLGLGFGGVGFGVAYDRFFTDRVTLTVTASDSVLVPGQTYNIGAKFYMHKGRIWQPRVTVLYGENTFVNTSCQLFCLIREYEAYKGFSLGFGQRFMLGKRKRHSIDLDYFYAVKPDSAKRRVETTDAIFSDTSNWSLSLGYRYSF